jgi:hypothetical protein
MPSAVPSNNPSSAPTERQPEISRTYTHGVSGLIFNVFSISINGNPLGIGSPARVVAESLVSLEFSYSIIRDQTGNCGNCWFQWLVGMAITSPFETVVFSECIASFSGGTTTITGGAVTISFTAPQTPGVYYMAQQLAAQFNCQDAVEKYAPIPNPVEALLELIVAADG